MDYLRSAYNKTVKVTAYPAKAYESACGYKKAGRLATGMALAGFMGGWTVKHIAKALARNVNPATVAAYGVSPLSILACTVLSAVQPFFYRATGVFIKGDSDTCKTIRYAISIAAPAIIAVSLGAAITPGGLFLLHGTNALILALGQYLSS